MHNETFPSARFLLKKESPKKKKEGNKRVTSPLDWGFKIPAKNGFPSAC
jgi:hypothetical protein